MPTPLLQNDVLKPPARTEAASKSTAAKKNFASTRKFGDALTDARRRNETAESDSTPIAENSKDVSAQKPAKKLSGKDLNAPVEESQQAKEATEASELKPTELPAEPSETETPAEETEAGDKEDDQSTARTQIEGTSASVAIQMIETAPVRSGAEAPNKDDDAEVQPSGPAVMKPQAHAQSAAISDIARSEPGSQDAAEAETLDQFAAKQTLQGSEATVVLKVQYTGDSENPRVAPLQSQLTDDAATESGAEAAKKLKHEMSEQADPSAPAPSHAAVQPSDASAARDAMSPTPSAHHASVLPAVDAAPAPATGSSASHTPVQTPATPPTSPELDFGATNHSKIVSTIRGELLPGGGSMQIRLDPPELGALQISVRMQDGVMSASFQTSSGEATKLLSHSLGQLKSALETQGVSVDKLQAHQSPRDEKNSNDSSNQQNHKSFEDGASARQEQQRKEILRRMWQRLAFGNDPLDMVA